MTEAVARLYRRFAELEAKDRSPVYAEVSAAVAQDERVLGFLAELPRPKWQPNLLFGAVQYLSGPITGWPDFRGRFLARTDEIREVMLARSTQTNEPARCGTLLPALAALPQPLALLEVGASAGLCLLPDRYGYQFDSAFGSVVLPGSPVLPCRVDAATPVPSRVPEVVWRAGLDLNPLDVRDEDDCAWLEALIWPGETEVRLPRLRAALAVARQDLPPVRRGDLRADVAALIDEAPSDATVVVFHTAVLAYVRDEDERRGFADTVLASRATWLSNEGPLATPGLPPGYETVLERDGFVLAKDTKPIALTDPHGTWVEWLGES